MLNFPSIIMVCGAPCSGKTYPIHYLISRNASKLNWGYVVCFIGIQSYVFMPDEFVTEIYQESEIERIVDLLRDSGESAFLVLDDCMGSVNWSNNFWIKLLSGHRHWNLTIIVASHYLSKIPPFLREYTNYCFLFRQNSYRSTKLLYEAFGQHGFETDREFSSFLREHTSTPYTTVLYKRDESDPQKKYITFRAPRHRNFRLKFVY